MDQEAVFVAADRREGGAPAPDQERFLASALARGPWDPAAQHGGAPAALLIRAFERLASDEGLGIARVTYEFLRPVPVGELTVAAEVVRPGRRARLLEGAIRTDADVEVVRARALEVRSASTGDLPLPSADPPVGPERGRDGDQRPPYRPMFAPDAIEIRFVSGTFHGPGPATAWFRLRVPLVDGEEASPLQRLAAAGDFGNGISSSLPWDEYLFINPDLTLYIERVPVGEWICLEAQTTIAPGGAGTAQSILYDRRGRVGSATQALVVAPR